MMHFSADKLISAQNEWRISLPSLNFWYFLHLSCLYNCWRYFEGYSILLYTELTILKNSKSFKCKVSPPPPRRKKLNTFCHLQIHLFAKTHYFLQFQNLTWISLYTCCDGMRNLILHLAFIMPLNSRSGTMCSKRLCRRTTCTAHYFVETADRLHGSRCFLTESVLSVMYLVVFNGFEDKYISYTHIFVLLQ